MGVPKNLSPQPSDSPPNPADVLVSLFPGDNKASTLPSAARWDQLLSRCSAGARSLPLLCVCSLTLLVLGRKEKQQDIAFLFPMMWSELQFANAVTFPGTRGAPQPYQSVCRSYLLALVICSFRFNALLIRANVLLVQLLRSTTRTSRLSRCGSSSGSMTHQRRRRRPVAGRRRQPVAAKRRLFRSCHGCMRMSSLPCSSAELSSAVDTCLHVRTAEPAPNVLLPLDLA